MGQTAKEGTSEVLQLQHRTHMELTHTVSAKGMSSVQYRTDLCTLSSSHSLTITELPSIVESIRLHPKSARWRDALACNRGGTVQSDFQKPASCSWTCRNSEIITQHIARKMTAKNNTYWVVQLTKSIVHQAVFKSNAHLLIALWLPGSIQDPFNVNKSHLQPPRGI